MQSGNLRATGDIHQDEVQPTIVTQFFVHGEKQGQEGQILYKQTARCLASAGLGGKSDANLAKHNRTRVVQRLCRITERLQSELANTGQLCRHHDKRTCMVVAAGDRSYEQKV